MRLSGFRPTSSAAGLRRFLMSGARLALAGLALACGTETSDGPQVASVRIDPPAVSINIGEKITLVATPLDAGGAVVVQTEATVWQSLGPTIASISAGGEVTGLAAGQAVVEAKIGTKTAQAIVTVIRQAVTQVSVAPGSVSLSRGGTGQFTARTVIGSGSEVTDRPVAWESTDPAVAQVTANGRTATVTAVAPGTASIRATSEGQLGQGVVVVAPDPVISLSSASVDLNTVRLGGDPPAAQVQVSNVGGGTLQGLLSPITFAPGGPVGWLTAQLSANTALTSPGVGDSDDGDAPLLMAPATLTLRATLGTLAQGTYTATVTVTSTSPQVTPRALTVRLIVAPGPSIAVAPTPVTFDAFAGGLNPAPRNVSVTNSGGAALSGLSLGTVTYGPGATGWLAAALSGATAPASITLTPGIATLPIGSYTATVPVASSLPGVATANVQVVLNVAQGPVITLSTTNVTFVGASGGSNPASAAVLLTNSGGGTLNGLAVGAVTYGVGASGWLTASIVPASAPATITLQASIAGVTAGTYTATVPVSSTVPGVAARTINVTLTVSSAPVINLSTSAITFQQVSGGPAPAAQTVNVTSGGSAPLAGLNIGTVTYSAGATGWLTASISSATAPATVTLTVTGVTPTIGSHTATVPVQGANPTAPASITVTINVSSGAVTAVASTASFTGVLNGAAPAAQQLPVTNSGVGALTGLSADAVVYAPTQATGWLVRSLSSATAPATLTLTANQAGLVAGTYNATVTLRSSLLGVAPKSVAVTLTVTSTTTIVLSTSAVTLNAPAGGANPTSVNVQVTSGTALPLTGLALGTVTYSAGATGWLTRSLSSATAPSTLTLGANVAGIASGTHTASFPISSPVASNSPQTVTVTLTVPVPVISASSASNPFSATQSIGTANAQTVNITNSGGGTLTGLTASISFGAQTGWLSATLNTTTAPATLTLALIPAKSSTMGRGLHTAVVSISAPGASNTPTITVPLTLIFTFDTHIANLGCAGACHNSIDHERPNLTDGDRYDAMRFGSCVSAGALITPFDTTNSCAYSRVASVTSPMPPTGFSTTIRNFFRGWILDGARRN